MEILKLYDLDLLKRFKAMVNSPIQGIYNEICKESEAWLTKKMRELDKSKLVPVELMGYHLSYFLAWNKFVAGERLSKLDSMIVQQAFTNSHFELANMLPEEFTQSDLETFVKALHFPINQNICSATGTSFRVEFDTELNFKLLQWAGLNQGYIPLSEKTTFENKVYESIIEFTSGNLLVNDWFRGPNNEFTSFFKNRDLDFDINSTQGRIAQMMHHALSNFVSINVGNTMPGVYVDSDKILVGEGPDLVKGDIFKGNVCTDLWNASIIDEDLFLSILEVQGLSRADAVSELQRQKDIWTTMAVKVAPGKYKLSFCGNYHEFSSKFTGSIPYNHQPYFILEKVND